MQRMVSPEFDAVAYKQQARERWDAAAEPWHRWTPALERWLGEATGRLLDMAGVAEGSRVLDVAAGTGLQTMAAARRVGPGGHVLATDLSAAILRYAAQQAREAGLANVETRELDGEHLDELAAGALDAAISRLGVMLMADPGRCLAGMRRALRPGGRAAVIVFSEKEKNPFLSKPLGIARRRAGLPPAKPGDPGPFSLASPETARGLFEGAGFVGIETRLAAAPMRMASAAECFRFEYESFGALHQMLGALSEEERQAAWREIEETLQQFDGPGGFEAPCELILAAGTK